MKKKKILFIIWSFSYGGGAERVLTNIVNNLNKEKYEIDILEYCYAGVKKEPINENITLYPPIIDYTNKKFSNKIKNFLIEKCVQIKPEIIRKKYLNKKYDIEIAFNNLIPSFLLDYENAKTICWVHGAIYNLKERNKLLEYQRKYFKKADRIVTISNMTYDSVKSLFPEFKEKISIINNGFLFDNILKSALEEKVEETDVLFCGRFDSNKNPIKMINIIKKAKEKKEDIKLGFLGQGELEEEVKELIKKYNLTENVKLFGYIKNPYTYIKSTKIMALTSFSEGFPTVLVEGMTLGKPFVSTLVAGTEEMSLNNKCGYRTNDDDEFANYIIKLLNDKKLYNKMSKECASNVLRFSLENQINNIENMMEEISK